MTPAGSPTGRPDPCLCADKLPLFAEAKVAVTSGDNFAGKILFCAEAAAIALACVNFAKDGCWRRPGILLAKLEGILLARLPGKVLMFTPPVKLLVPEMLGKLLGMFPTTDEAMVYFFCI